MPPRGTRARKVAAWNHGAQLPSDHVTLWETDDPDVQVLLIGPHMQWLGNVYVHRPGKTQGSVAWQVVGAGLNSTRAPGAMLSLRKQLPLDRDLRKSAAAVFRIGGENAVRTMLVEGRQLSLPVTMRPAIMLPLFLQAPGEQLDFHDAFPMCSHTEQMWDRLLVYEGSKLRTVGDPSTVYRLANTRVPRPRKR